MSNSRVTIPVAVDELLREIESETGTRFSEVNDRVGLLNLRSGVRSFVVLPGDSDLDSLKETLRARLDRIEWQLSEMNERRSLVLTAPMIRDSSDVAYHATRRSRARIILRDGLLPSDPSRSNTGRADCTGNIYVCRTLGKAPADLSAEPEKGTAQWWRWHLSGRDQADASEWCILRVDLTDLQARVYRDIWSTSGLIVDGIDHIPPERLEMIWPE